VDSGAAWAEAAACAAQLLLQTAGTCTPPWASLTCANYLEHEDEVKNPSWQRRQHRFLPAVKSPKVKETSAKKIIDTVEPLLEKYLKYTLLMARHPTWSQRCFLRVSVCIFGETVQDFLGPLCPIPTLTRFMFREE